MKASNVYILLLLLSAVFHGSALLRAQEPDTSAPTGVADAVIESRPADDTIWSVSTRHLRNPNPQDGETPDFQISRYNQNDEWEDTNLDALLDETVSYAATIVYVHGNRVGWSRSFDRGLEAYHALLDGAVVAGPIRFIIWSWPSTQICGPLRDVRSKALRSDYDSVFLARFLNRLAPDQRIGLFGFSYGGRVISGAMHVLGGGEIYGWSLDHTTVAPHRPMRIALLGPALHNYWLLPNRFHGNCASAVEQILIQYNSADRVLSLYRHVAKRSRPQALGATGFLWEAELPADAAPIDQENVAGVIGNNHTSSVYFRSAQIMDSVRSCLLPANAQASL